MQAKSVPIFARILAEKAGLMSTDLTFAQLTEHAIESMRPKANVFEIVCGPITTGGFGNIGLNTLLFNHAIELLMLEGRPMFNQIPYEYQLARLEDEWKNQNTDAEYCHPILTEFYQPVFESGFIIRGWFLPGWERSTGATWEHEMLTRLGCDVRYLPERWIYELNVAP